MREFIVFGLKNARSCVFAGSFLALLLLTHFFPVPAVSRADVLFVGALLIQAVLLLTKLETGDEAKVILLFHAIGLGLELFKTSPAIAAWSYPDTGTFHVANVPLYSGFMYAAVGSFISQAWKVFRLELLRPPSYALSVALCAAIYLNFFTNEFFYDFRWVLCAAVAWVYRHTWVAFTVTDARRRLPMTLSFVLIAFFIWIAENIGTYSGAWLYPQQVDAWSLVSFRLVSSWALLVILSFVIVAYLKHVKAGMRSR